MRKNEKQHDQNGRAAFVAGKKLGNAVWRNKAKRRMRSICHDLDLSYPGFDIVFLARSRVNEISYEELLFQVKQAFEKKSVLFS